MASNARTPSSPASKSSGAYRDELDAALAHARALANENELQRRALVEAEARLEACESVLVRMRTAIGEGPPRPPSTRPSRARVTALVVAGVVGVTLVAAAGSRLARIHGAPPQAVAAPPVMAMPVTSTPAPSAAPPTSAEPQGAAGTPCAGEPLFVELTHDGTTERLTGGCQFGSVTSATPTGEILEKSGGEPYLIVDACTAGKRFSIVGPAARLPGPVFGLPEAAQAGPRVRLAEGRSERDSRASTVRVTKFGKVGELIEGELHAAMQPRLNEEPLIFEGRFRVCRTRDRFPP
jgi:hypothetical protein